MNKWQQRLSGEQNTRPNDHRDDFQRDRARVLHSSAFRRLQAKTQILSVGVNDFHRTRLTHSLEVAQIGTGLVAQLKQHAFFQEHPKLKAMIPSDSLMDTLCLAHDLGHPPFGHGGEVALNYVMNHKGGFEANGQTFRILTKLEPYTEHFGMDLTRRSLLGLIKYPRLIDTKLDLPKATNYLIKAKDYHPQKGLLLCDKNEFEWVIEPFEDEDKVLFCQTKNDKTQYKSFDASIMELADDIAYGVHDLEDAIVLNKVTRQSWFDNALPNLLKIDNLWSKKHANHLSDMLFSGIQHQRKNAIGALVNHLITNIDVEATNENFHSNILKYNACLTAPAKELLALLKSFVFKHVILATDIQQLEFKGQQMLMAMFDAYTTDPERLLPKPTYNEITSNNSTPERIICDFLASMSDEQATRSYQQLFSQ